MTRAMALAEAEAVEVARRTFRPRAAAARRTAGSGQGAFRLLSRQPPAAPSTAPSPVPATEPPSPAGPAGPPGRQRFPRAPWAGHMRAQLCRELEATLRAGGVSARGLRLGTDCAGAEAPVFALREISRELAESMGLRLRVDHRFACDVGYASREFIARNCLPAALFCDLLARDTTSHCLRAEMPRVVPSNLDVYVAGFPCKDFSMLNRHRPGLEGPNAGIFHGVVHYIRRHEPRTYVLENVWGLTLGRNGQEAPIHEVMRTLRAIPHYQVRGWRVNTQDFHLPQNRKRIYIVGVHTKKVKLRRPLAAWNQYLRRLEQRAAVPAHSFMLHDDEPEVRNERERQCEHPRQEELPRSASPEPAMIAGLGDAEGTASNPPRQGLRWVKKHRIMRVQLGLHNRPLTVPAPGSWAKFLTVRTRDVLDMTAARVAQVAHRRAEDTSFISEISRGLNYTICMDSVSPCVTPACRLWVFNRSRWMIGIEKFALQGFPVDSLDLADLSEGEIATLAGNAMSVPVVGAFLYLVLALVSFPVDAPSAHR